MSVPDVGRAKAELLASFTWTSGHADFAKTFRRPGLLHAAGPALASPFEEKRVSAVVSIEARGFVWGALAARALGVGLILVRKPGSIHPGARTETAATADWKGRHVELQISLHAIEAGDLLLLVDDWIETGTQARTVATLVRKLGADLAGVSVLVDDTSDEVRSDLNVVGLVRSAELPPDS